MPRQAGYRYHHPRAAYPRFITEGRGLCADQDPDLFSDTSGRGRTRLNRMAEAVKVCDTPCPFKAACLVFALETDQPGVWGGTIDEERTAMRKAASHAA